MNSALKDKRIDSLQALRGISFLGIFLAHALAPFGWPEIAVSVFFVLSGFLLTLHYYEDGSISCSFKLNFQFALKRIKPLYGLHLATLVLSIPLQMYMKSLEYVKEHLIDIVYNIFLVQSWIPIKSVNVSYNGVSWFLSTIFFLYFCFPAIIRAIRKISFYELFALLLLLLSTQVVGCYILLKANTDASQYEWFMYHFPLFRLPDFYCGCLLGKEFLVNNKRIEKRNTSLFICLEFFLLIATILIYRWAAADQTSVLLRAMNNATTIYIIPAGLWVVLFAIKKGPITRIISNMPLVYLGDISGYAFLIHLLVIQYFDNICYYFHFNMRDGHNWLVVIICFIITIIISSGIFWIKRIRKRK